MNDYPEYAEVNGKKYKINTDFRTAIKCNEIAMDESIGKFERALGIIYLLFGDEGLQDEENYMQLLKIAKTFLSCGNETQEGNHTAPDMDYIQDMPYIEASFMSDYHIWLPDIEMHWWKFFYLINGLSNSEMGNCCILNKIRNLRTMDTSKIKDVKELERINKAKRQFALKGSREFETKVELTEEQKKSVDELYKSLGF